LQSVVLLAAAVFPLVVFSPGFRDWFHRFRVLMDVFFILNGTGCSLPVW